MKLALLSLVHSKGAVGVAPLNLLQLGVLLE